MLVGITGVGVGVGVGVGTWVTGVPITCTVQEAEAPLPSAAFAVMIAEPLFQVVTRPVEVTVATSSSLEDQVSAGFVALEGSA